MIGWFTNYLAIKSLFRPVKPINFGLFKFQGVIPKRRRKIINNLTQVIEDYMFSNEDILKELNKKSNIKSMKDKLLPIIEQKIMDKIPEMFQMVAGPILHKILNAELENILHKIIKEFGSGLIDAINVKEIIAEKLHSYDVSNMEHIVNKIAKQEFKHIELLGALIGFIIGIFQVLLMVFVG